MLWFVYPLLWALAVPLAVLLVWTRRHGYAQLTPRGRSASIAVRGLILLLLIAALARPEIERSTTRRHVVFLVDISQSVSDADARAAADGLDRLLAETDQQPSTQTSLVAFGRRPKLLLEPSTEHDALTPEARDAITHRATLRELYTRRTRATDDNQREELRTRIDTLQRLVRDVVGEQTDLDSALRLALNCGEPGDARTVVLVSDANFTRGSWERALDSARQADASLSVATLGSSTENEVAALQLRAPARVRVNEGFSARGVVAATADCQADIVVYKDGALAYQERVGLAAGDNTIDIPGLYFFDKGFHTLELTVRTAESDTEPRNNTIRTQIVVPGPARVLYIDSDESQMHSLKSALEIEGMSVEARPTLGVPNDLDDLLGFDALILSNVPADTLSANQMRIISSYVRDFGGGFIMLGGDQSFGLGGYYNTPIERVLPVRVPIQRDMNRPTLAIQLVIDKSGSMAGPKIELAKRSAIETANVINPRDLIGVVGFDSESRVVLELTPAGNRGDVSSSIEALDAGGGTFLQPALQIAYQQLMSSAARRKHVIILSDGQTEGYGYEDIAGSMAADGITVSTVGIGDGADRFLLESMAIAGGGRSYFTNDFQSLPQIFTREALRASRGMLVEGVIEPIAVADDPAIEGLDAEQLPLLTGYVATTPRPEASVPIISDSGDPILARWRAGLGRAAAFTSEPKPRWGEDWLSWSDFARFWSQLVRSVAGDDLRRTINAECWHNTTDDGIELLLDAQDARGDFVNDAQVSLTLLTPDGTPEPIDVSKTAPGLFRARLSAEPMSQSKHAVWQIEHRSSPDTLVVPYAVPHGYPAEFRSLGPNRPALDGMRRAGLTVEPINEASVEPGSARSTVRTPLWQLCLALGLLLVPLDILVRRVMTAA